MFEYAMSGRGNMRGKSENRKAHFSVRFDVDQIDRDEEKEEKERRQPVQMRRPVRDDDLRGRQISRRRNRIVETVVPPECEPERVVDETRAVRRERSRLRVFSRHLPVHEEAR